MEIKLDDVKINVPTKMKENHMYFLRYDGETVKFVLPNRLYCFCHKDCDFCWCGREKGYIFCTCISSDQVQVRDILKFEYQIENLIEDKYVWCWVCDKYVWYWEYCPH